MRRNSDQVSFGRCAVFSSVGKDCTGTVAITISAAESPANRLNVCVPSNPYVETLNPKAMAFGEVGSWGDD